ncbi:hypothetical protein LBMAG53_01260 [Planctomycetota bacterium]|nr:hypothetical protein LBMAG53_01260 [Planctomycetota bacterium]
MRRPRHLLASTDDGHLDLVPLIDCVFLILLFFMLVGRISVEQRHEQITVPPTRSGQVPPPLGANWIRVVVNVFGSTAAGNIPRNAIAWNSDQPWISSGQNEQDFVGYQKLRDKLDLVYDRSRTFDDPNGAKAPGGGVLQLPSVIVEVRADADTEYRVVQDIQMLLVDSVNPRPDQSGASMQPKVPQKPFVNLEFTTRKPGDR